MINHVVWDVAKTSVYFFETNDDEDRIRFRSSARADRLVSFGKTSHRSSPQLPVCGCQYKSARAHRTMRLRRQCAVLLDRYVGVCCEQKHIDWHPLYSVTGKRHTRRRNYTRF